VIFSGSPKKKMLAAIVGPSISSGIFVGLAINAFEKEHGSVELRLFSIALCLVLAGSTLFIAIDACKKVLRAWP